LEGNVGDCCTIKSSPLDYWLGILECLKIPMLTFRRTQLFSLMRLQEIRISTKKNVARMISGLMSHPDRREALVSAHEKRASCSDFLKKTIARRIAQFQGRALPDSASDDGFQA